MQAERPGKQKLQACRETLDRLALECGLRMTLPPAVEPVQDHFDCITKMARQQQQQTQSEDPLSELRRVRVPSMPARSLLSIPATLHSIPASPRFRDDGEATRNIMRDFLERAGMLHLYVEGMTMDQALTAVAASQLAAREQENRAVSWQVANDPVRGYLSAYGAGHLYTDGMTMDQAGAALTPFLRANAERMVAVRNRLSAVGLGNLYSEGMTMQEADEAIRQNRQDWRDAADRLVAARREREAWQRAQRVAADVEQSTNRAALSDQSWEDVVNASSDDDDGDDGRLVISVDDHEDDDESLPEELPPLDENGEFVLGEADDVPINPEDDSDGLPRARTQAQAARAADVAAAVAEAVAEVVRADQTRLQQRLEASIQASGAADQPRGDFEPPTNRTALLDRPRAEVNPAFRVRFEIQMRPTRSE